MVGREADRARVVAEVVEAQRLGVMDQDAEDAAPVRQLADRFVLLAVDAGGDEALECLALAVDHPERRVAGAGQGCGGVDQPLQQLVELVRQGAGHAEAAGRDHVDCRCDVDEDHLRLMFAGHLETELDRLGRRRRAVGRDQDPLHHRLLQLDSAGFILGLRIRPPIRASADLGCVVRRSSIVATTAV